MSGYRRGYGRRGYAPTVGRVRKANGRPGECRTCGVVVPAGAGELWREEDGSWSVVHTEASQGGWAMDPRPVTGGCPDATDKRNAELHKAGFFGPGAPLSASERERIAAAAAAAPPVTVARSRGGKYAYTSTGARVTMSSRRCEDAPCCGCCD